jgi:hypothetical protein
MKFISHRGNILSKNVKLENTIPYINDALSKGYYVEIDVWLIKDKLYLGHDNPDNITEKSFLCNDKILCHAKNREAFEYMLKYPEIHCFWHQEDEYTLSSLGIPIVYPNKTPINNSIVMVRDVNILRELINRKDIYGICCDFIGVETNGS